ncbi:sensor domain-containing diguanylate cyclase [Thalassotalea insulae]|nr:sensor domain-containing diguanylate cyclase [Thalassotalea insulae]
MAILSLAWKSGLFFSKKGFVVNARKYLFLVLLLPSFVSFSSNHSSDFLSVFQRHSAIMLMIAPDSGHIVYANEAASAFYGYPVNKLTTLTIQDINMLTPEQVAVERENAERENRRYFIFRHQIASGDIKTVKVYSIPIQLAGKSLLYSVIQDISLQRQLSQELWHYQASLEQAVDLQTAKTKNKTSLINMLLAIGMALMLVTSGILFYLLKRKNLIEEKSHQLSQIVEQSPVAIATTDLSGHIDYVNQKFIRDCGYSKEELIGSQPSLLTDDSLDARVYHQVVASVARGKTWIGELYTKSKNGEKFWERVHLYPIKNVQGSIVNYVAIKENITELKEDEKQLRLASTVFQTATEGVMISDADNIIVAVNDAFTQITGFSQQEVLGKKPSILSSGHHDDAFYQQMQQTLDAKDSWQGEICNRRKDGEIYYEWLSITAIRDERGELEAYVSLLSDITQRKKNADKIYYQANFDALTGLANRNLFLDRFNQMLEQANRNGQKIALFFIDLDGFKGINDNLGHAIGDLLLQQVAERLSQSVRKSDTVTRLGGDEFAIILTENDDLDAVARIASKIQHSIAEPFQLKQHQAILSASIGITIYPEHGNELDELLNKADSAMYRAKQNGRNNYQFYRDSEEIL